MFLLLTVHGDSCLWRGTIYTCFRTSLDRVNYPQFLLPVSVTQGKPEWLPKMLCGQTQERLIPGEVQWGKHVTNAFFTDLYNHWGYERLLRSLTTTSRTLQSPLLKPRTKCTSSWFSNSTTGLGSEKFESFLGFALTLTLCTSCLGTEHG